MKIIPSGSVDVVFADPPYRLSRGGVTVKSGRLAPVDKGTWDRSMGFAGDHRFNVRWLKEACRILKPDGTIWVTGTHHIIFSLGFALQTMKFKIINAVAWEKPDPPPNALHTAFTHAHETIVWAKEHRSRHTFNYDLINSRDPSAQVSSVWRILPRPGGRNVTDIIPPRSRCASCGAPSWPPPTRGDLVFDPFCGSGTSGVASRSLGASCGSREGGGVCRACGAQDRGCAAWGGVARDPWRRRLVSVILRPFSG